VDDRIGANPVAYKCGRVFAFAGSCGKSLSSAKRGLKIAAGKTKLEQMPVLRFCECAGWQMTGMARVNDSIEPDTLAGGQEKRRRGSERGTSVITRTKPQVKKPSLYRVLLLNDDYTPMEFVIHVLERFFQKDREQATRIMLHVHNHGVGECGVFTYEVAETKVTQVMDFARTNHHPLQCVMEKK
jgi:ATP-dependent Clp protease adaptor protein ClpS